MADSPMTFVVAHYALLALLALISYVIGRRLAMRMVFRSLPEELSVCIGLGLGTVATIALLLGVMGWLYAPVLLAVLGLILVLPCAPVWKELVQRARAQRAKDSVSGSRPRREVLVRAALLLVVALGVAFAWPWVGAFLSLPLYPPTHFDATMYHLPTARAFADSHGLPFLPHIRFPVFPQLNETLFALMLLVADDVAAQLVQFLMMLLAALALFGWGKRLLMPSAGAWAAGLWLASPLVIWLGTSAFVDVGLTFFTLMGVYAFWVWCQDHERGWLACSGAFCGFAAGTKYLALLIIIALTISAIYVAWRRRRYAAPLVFAGMTALVAMPWYARIIYHTGNPVFPFAAPTFGASDWDFDAIKRPDTAPAPRQELVTVDIGGKQYRMSRLAALAAGPVELAVGLLSRLASDIPGLLMLPWNVSHRPEMFHGLPPLTSALLLAVPVFLLVGVTSLRTRAALALGVAYTLLWYSVSRDLRYVLPAVPLLTLGIAEALERLLAAMKVPRRVLGHWSVALLGLVVLSSSGWLYAHRTRATFGALPHDAQLRDQFLEQHVMQTIPVPVTGLHNALRPAYLSRHFPQHRSNYGAYQLLNRRLGSNYTVYGLYDENMAHFAAGRFIGDWTGPARFANLHERIASGEVLYAFLKQFGVDYFLVSMRRAPVQLPQDDFFLNHFRPVYDREAAVYELLDAGTVREFGAELLQNGGFEAVAPDGHPQGWKRSGQPTIDANGGHNGAALCGRGSDNAAMQTARVEEGESYRYRFHARAAADEQPLRYQIHWSDSEGKLLFYDIRVVAAQTQWKEFQITTVAPERATYVTVFASPHGDSTICFDDVSLQQVRYEPASTQAGG